MVEISRCNKTYAIQVVQVSSSEDSPVKDGITQGKRKMGGNFSKRKLFVAVNDDKKDNTWYSCKLVVIFNKLPVHENYTGPKFLKSNSLISRPAPVQSETNVSH